MQTKKSVVTTNCKKSTEAYAEEYECISGSSKITENEGEKPKELKAARLDGIPKRKYSKGLLGCCRK